MKQYPIKIAAIASDLFVYAFLDDLYIKLDANSQFIYDKID